MLLLLYLAMLSARGVVVVGLNEHERMKGTSLCTHFPAHAIIAREGKRRLRLPKLPHASRLARQASLSF